MRAVSERARYHLTESLAFFVIVPNANCLPRLGSVQSSAKFSGPSFRKTAGCVISRDDSCTRNMLMNNALRNALIYSIATYCFAKPLRFLSWDLATKWFRLSMRMRVSSSFFLGDVIRERIARANCRSYGSSRARCYPLATCWASLSRCSVLPVTCATWQLAACIYGWHERRKIKLMMLRERVN